MHKTIARQNIANRVRHIQKETKAIAVIHNNIILTHGAHPHVRVIREVINIHIAPIIEQIKHNAIKMQFIIKKLINISIMQGQIQVINMPKMIQGHMVIQQQIESKSNINI